MAIAESAEGPKAAHEQGQLEQTGPKTVAQRLQS